MLALLGIYRREDFLAALDRAVRYGAFSMNSVERILAVRARPKTCFDRMAEEESSHLEGAVLGRSHPAAPGDGVPTTPMFEESDQDDNTEEDTGQEEGDQEEGGPSRRICVSGCWTMPRRSGCPFPPKCSMPPCPAPSRRGSRT